MEYKTVYEGNEAEIIEKKSRFIATVRPAGSEEEALEFIESMRKKYWDASHNCFAYVVGTRCELQRCSDDGEPGGTAGRPMLDVLLGEGLHDTAVVVTRYFGGTLLGTGGLVRAYQGAAKAGIQASTVITKKSGRKWNLVTDYTGLGKIQYILGQRKSLVLNISYEENVKMILLLSGEEEKEVTEELVEGTGGKVILEAGEECQFAKMGKETLVFPA